MNYVLTLLAQFKRMSSTQVSTQIPDFIAFGNVLFDMTVAIDNNEILQRYGLTLENQGLLSSETLSEITELVNQRYKVLYNPGGSALNTCRIMRKLNCVTPKFFGAVGNDKYADHIRVMMDKAELSVSFQVIDNAPTGKCICFVIGDQTGLYANIGASEKFSKALLMENTEEFDCILRNDKIQIFYIEGFFVPHRYDVCDYIVKTYVSSSKKLALNLSAEYVIQENFEEMKCLIESASFVFGNKSQFTALAKFSGFEEIEDVMKSLLCKKEKIFVCTNGSENIYVYENISCEYKCEEFEPIKVREEDMVDTTGAGDSFVAGFLDAFLLKKDLAECVAAGCNVASIVITQVGCNIP